MWHEEETIAMEELQAAPGFRARDRAIGLQGWRARERARARAIGLRRGQERARRARAGRGRGLGSPLPYEMQAAALAEDSVTSLSGLGENSLAALAAEEAAGLKETSNQLSQKPIAMEELLLLLKEVSITRALILALTPTRTRTLKRALALTLTLALTPILDLALALALALAL